MLMDKSDEFIGKEGVETEVKLKLEGFKKETIAFVWKLLFLL